MCLVGKKFGKLTVTGIEENGKTRTSYYCKCDCGEELVLGKSKLLGTKNGRRANKSCGCSQNKHEGLTQKHHRIYNIWNQMMARCYRKQNENYYRYGGKGIGVCKEWHDFKTFLKWALNRDDYRSDLTLDRIDNTKDYSPDNCRWVDMYKQEQHRGVQTRNKTGILGVCPHPSGYRAYITRYGERKYLGVYKTAEEAKEARQKAEEKFNETGEL